MTSKKQYIPARLKNISHDDPYVAGVEDIVDDATGKTQEEINTETTEKIEEVKGGSTESIADLREAVDNETTRAEGVESGIDTRLQTVEQHEQIMVEGGTIGIATASDFTNRTTAGDAKVPTVAALTNGMGEGLWDISAHNNNATYADLTAALGTNGVNVPESIRRGGMSVKFVQSSDNNSLQYVQYRLMSDTFNTTVANWQGIDDKPTDDSHNLVESGGVNDGLNVINDKIGNEEIFTYSKLCGKRYAGGVIIAASTTQNGIIIPLTEDATYDLLTGDVTYVVFTSLPIIGDTSNISRVIAGNVSTITVLDGEKYILATILVNTTPSVSVKRHEINLAKRVTDLEHSVDNIDNEVGLLKPKTAN